MLKYQYFIDRNALLNAYSLILNILCVLLTCIQSITAT